MGHQFTKCEKEDSLFNIKVERLSKLHRRHPASLPVTRLERQKALHEVKEHNYELVMNQTGM